VIGALHLPVAGLAATPDGTWFVGEWSCAARDGSGHFT
jgi:hypothetical protein